MENYDPEFANLVSKGDILLGGYNFGTGSSREQAATSLKYCGIQMVLAGSFSQTYKRNATSRAAFSSDTEAINASNFKYGTPAGEAEFLKEDLPNTRADSKTLPPLPHWVRR